MNPPGDDAMASDLRTEDTNNDGYKPIALHYLSVHDLSVQEQAVNRSLYTDESGATRLPYLTLDASAVSSSLSSDHEKRSLSSLGRNGSDVQAYDRPRLRTTNSNRNLATKNEYS